MRISAPGRAERGLTLVELLVVMLIIGMTAAVVMFAVPRGPSELQTAVRMVEADVAAMRDRAVSEVALYGLLPNEAGYARYRAEEGAWTLIDQREIPRDVAFEILPEEGWQLPEHRSEVILGIDLRSDEDEEDVIRPTIVFGPEGSVTPFAVNLREGRLDATVRVGPFGKIGEDEDA